MVELLPGLRNVRISDADGLDTEVYILECDGGLILVDVGFTPECHENIQSELDSMSKTWSEIKMIIITHAHGDHINNLAQIRELTDAEIVIGAGDEDKLEEHTGIPADIILDTGDVIEACGNIEIVRVPGHSDGNLCIYLYKYKALIAGDTIFGDNTDYPYIYPPPEKYCTDVKQAAENLKMLLEYDFDILLMTHGRNIHSNAKKIVKEMLEREKIICTRL
ncbi:MBL fold metallo-hydrolase [Thermoproteota archaeon]